MKQLILILMFILCLPFVYSIYGGETWTYHFDECDKLRVNITAIGIIDDGEYTILNNCTEELTNYWICNCSNDFNFNVNFHPSAINNYTLYFNYDYSRFEQEQPTGDSPSSSSGGSSSSFTARLNPNKTLTFFMKQGVISRFLIDETQHTAEIIEIGDNYVILELKSNPLQINLSLNKPETIKLGNDNVTITLKEIRGKTAFIEFEKRVKTKINGYDLILSPDNKTLVFSYDESQPKTEEIIGDGCKDGLCQPPEVKYKKSDYLSSFLIIAGVGLVVILSIIIYHYYYTKNKKRENDDSVKAQ